jgi:alpha-glucosidase (family GH31 glycosyl hydrolase)
VTIVQQSEVRTHITIVPPGQNRWEVPSNLLPRPGGLYTGNTGFRTSAEITSTAPFSMEVVRLNGQQPATANDVIFNFTKDLVYQDQYIQFSLTSPANTIATYGFGESTRSVQQLQLNTTYTLWNTDIAAADFGVTLYGAHPFIIQVQSDGKASGFMFMNSNSMELTVVLDSNGRQRLNIQATGGILDLYVLGGPTPSNVIAQYLEIIGKPAMIPFWSLGFHNVSLS